MLTVNEKGELCFKGEVIDFKGKDVGKFSEDLVYNYTFNSLSKTNNEGKNSIYTTHIGIASNNSMLYLSVSKTNKKDALLISYTNGVTVLDYENGVFNGNMDAKTIRSLINSINNNVKDSDYTHRVGILEHVLKAMELYGLKYTKNIFINSYTDTDGKDKVLSRCRYNSEVGIVLATNLEHYTSNGCNIFKLDSKYI